MISRNAHPFTAVREFALATLFASTRKSGISLLLAALWLCAPASLRAQTFTSVFSFDGANGIAPVGLVQATDGNLYGITSEYGSAGTESSGGTIFKITPSGTLTTLFTFNGEPNNDYGGVSPAAGLIQGTDGNFYGTTQYGGANTYGTVFKITPSGTLTTLHSFHETDGGSPLAGLIQATDGNFYGTNSSGGVDFDGTIFKITPSGTLTALHSFDGTDGDGLTAALVQATDGNFYGTTLGGGANGYGTVFRMTPSGTLATLHSFDNTDGRLPNAIIQDTSGTLYGTTESGTSVTGKYHRCTGICGTVFSLSVDLSPFVKTRPASGAAGVAVNILGTNLTGATSVTFNGTAAKFTVVSSSEITTVVPAGATTGELKVVTPSGTLSSNVSFMVP
jgi:uncharacterized repeat protein (TIGR03803 family)